MSELGLYLVIFLLLLLQCMCFIWVAALARELEVQRVKTKELRKELMRRIEERGMADGIL
ncbi:MAG: hypothetical protein PHI12_13000 [Dehalococcoidales bacterium]|nr:hypothetical protein [Methanoregulaceae archaeon]MDD5511709.1 hypothetical protein [Dehalococcoidales bacterium]